ncbi:MAG: hypothetical protein DBY35_11545 [Bacteroidales bacterium]|nr:MAG: hypothetical protein DBY35_11545 [Bacteroidales bacterium]
MINDFSKIDYRFCTIISLLSILYIDYFAKNAIGYIITLAIFIYLIYYSFKNLFNSFKIFIILFTVLPPFPRNILDVYEHIQVTHTISYNVITGMPFIGMSMVQWLTLFYILMFIVEIINHKISFSKSYLNLFLFIIILPLTISAIQFLLAPENFLFREVITGIRFPIYLLLGLLFYIRYKSNINQIGQFLVEVLIASSIIFCVRVPFFLILSMFENTPSLDLGVVPHIPLAVMFSLFLMPHKTKGMIYTMGVCIFSLLSPSRGQIFMFFVLVLLYLWISKFKLSKIKHILSLAFIGFFVIMSMTLFNDRLYEFFLWKLSEFSPSSEGISESGLVRVYEFLNITDSIRTNIISFLFGSGLSGYFTFDAYPFPFPEHLDLKSYQDFELAKGIYYHPHFFINIVLLKFGLIGLCAYIGFILSYFNTCRKKYYIAQNNASFLLSFGFFFAISLLLDMHFRGYYAVLFPILFLYTSNIYVNIKSKNKLVKFHEQSV